MNGIVCVDKPQGFTSFDVVAKMRGILNIRKIGHGGTLDPMATGVLPIFIGNATKACDIMPVQSKKYKACFQLGITTDTQDSTGRILIRKKSEVTKKQILDILPHFTGEIEQIPPMYSAVKVDGKRLYDLARQGMEVQRSPRLINIYKLELLDYDASKQTGILSVFCSKGTYVRTICHDIGQLLCCGAVMTALERTESGIFTKEDCYRLEQIQLMKEQSTLERQALLPVEQVFKGFPAIQLSEKQSWMFRNGAKLDLNRIQYHDPASVQRILDYSGEFLGLATCDLAKEELRIYKLFLT